MLLPYRDMLIPVSRYQEVLWSPQWITDQETAIDLGVRWVEDQRERKQRAIW